MGISCAPAQGSLQLYVPEADAALAEGVEGVEGVEVETHWWPVETQRPVYAYVAAPAYTGDEPVREVVYTDPGELPRLHSGAMPLPLRHTAVRAHLRGTVAEVVVKQRFVNGGELALEAIYTFPLPENSAVTDMRMVIGERVIASQIRERGEARRVYDDARESGHRAALLEQERPNIFTQSIANIPAGEAIDVEIRYVQTLSYDAGEYEFVFPTVVGPRYAPTARVADAGRISPPVLGHGQRSGHDLSIEVIAETGSAITGWAAPAHAVEVAQTGSQLAVKLARRDEIANRDFVLRYRSAAAQPAARLFLGAPGKHGSYFMLVAEPPRVDVDTLVGRRELVFVVDVSGSMSGAPLELAKATLREALAGVRPVDTFDVVVFAGRTARLFDAPRPASAENLRVAADFIDGLSAGGGTEMADAVHSSLHAPVGEGRHRYVFFLTDGFIGDEAQIAGGAQDLIAAQRRLGRRARVFGVGIGSSPNGELITRLSRAGDGLPLYIRGGGDIGHVVNSFQRMIDAPVLSDVSIDWGGLKIDSVYPNAAPDLFASHPLVVHGHFTGPAPTQLELRGTVEGRAVAYPITISPMSERSDILGALWARARVGSLDLRAATGDLGSDQARAEILAVGLHHRIVTAYTSLVAVDSSSRVTGPPGTIVQPVEQVDGMDRGSAMQVPVGGTSRDFTAVLDLSPTARRDAAGVRLAGTSGAESRYVVDGSKPHRRTRVPVEIQRLERAARASAPGPALGYGVEVHARASLRSLTGAERATSDVLRQRLDTGMADLSMCFVAAPRATYRVRRGVTLRVSFGAGGRITALKIVGPGTGDAALSSCLAQRLGRLLATSAAMPPRLTIELTVAMQF